MQDLHWRMCTQYCHQRANGRRRIGHLGCITWLHRCFAMHWVTISQRGPGAPMRIGISYPSLFPNTEASSWSSYAGGCFVRECKNEGKGSRGNWLHCGTRGSECTYWKKHFYTVCWKSLVALLVDSDLDEEDWKSIFSKWNKLAIANGGINIPAGIRILLKSDRFVGYLGHVCAVVNR
jgi:hypothetical protein